LLALLAMKGMMVQDELTMDDALKIMEDLHSHSCPPHLFTALLLIPVRVRGERSRRRRRSRRRSRRRRRRRRRRCVVDKMMCL